MTKKIYPLASILSLLFVLIFIAFPLSARAQSNGWDFIKVSPESGNWNYPGTFILKAQRAVTVSWIIKCTYGGCNRSAETVNNFTFTAGQTIKVGWGHQCYAWQFDEVGGVGFIAEKETSGCTPAASPTPPATSVPPSSTPTATNIPPSSTPAPTSTVTSIPPETTTATPTSDVPTPTTPPVTSTPPPATSTAVVVPPTLTQTPAPPAPPQPQQTEVVVLPVTGQAPPASPLSSPLWPALAALLLLALSGRMIWTGILQAESVQLPVNVSPALHSQARKALILLILSLLILAILVLPSIIRQAALDFGEPGAYSPLSLAIAHQALPNHSSGPLVQQPVLKAPSASQALDGRLSKDTQPRSPKGENSPVIAPAGVNQAAGPVDNTPVVRLVIPALKVDSKVQSVPFENHTWDITKLNMDIAWLGNTSSPGLGSNTVLAGHITVLYLGNGPFRYLYSLKPGDLVYVYSEENLYTYSVREQAVVVTNDPSVVGPTDHPQLTLLTCTGWDDETLRYTKRRAVFADLMKVLPISSQSTGDLPVWH